MNDKTEIHIHLTGKHSVEIIGDSIAIKCRGHEDQDQFHEPWSKEKKAFAEGRRIQFLVYPTCWRECRHPRWYKNIQYRIHPEDEDK